MKKSIPGKTPKEAVSEKFGSGSGDGGLRGFLDGRFGADHLGADNQGVRPARPLGVKNVPIEIEDDPIPEADYFPTRNSQGPSLEVVNGWQSRINQRKATPGDLQWWKGKAGSRAIIRPTTFVRAGVSEPAVAVYLDGDGVQFGWIAREHIPAVKREMHGYLAGSGP